MLYWCILLTAAPLAANQAEPSSIAPFDLRCEHLVNPQGIDLLQPRLSWRLANTDSQARGQSQRAWQVLVASTRELLNQDQADLWNSGRVESDASILRTYQGQPLNSRQVCWWKVRVWDQDDQVSTWSLAAYWTMGLLRDSDWQGAQWIGLEGGDEQGMDIDDVKAAKWLWYPEGNPAHDAPTETRYFRRTLEIPEGRSIRRAACFFAGDDLCQFYVNGALVGIARGHTSLAGAEIASLLKPGANELACAATNVPSNVPNNPGGWVAAVRLEFAEGPPLIVRTDAGWRSSKQGPQGWQVADVSDEQWPAAQELGDVGMAPWGMPWKDRWESEHRRLPARYLRREIDNPSGKIVQRATATVCGLGFFDLHVNGRRIGDEIMNPALTGYDKRMLYVTYDLTEQFQNERNAVGIVLANGRYFAPRHQNPMPMHNYGYPKLLLNLVVEYSDGSRQTIVSDSHWKVTDQGPIRSSNEFDGEEYDARMELIGWDAPGFDDSTWTPAPSVESPGGALEAQMIEPIRVTEELRPKLLAQPKPGVWMVDFGQAFYGVVRLKVAGKEGDQVSIRTSFNVLPDGTLNYFNDRSAHNTEVYTLRGEGDEVWHPRFRGNATRWAQVEGFPGTPTEDSFTGLVLHTDHARTGEFECSNAIVNRAYLNGRWGTRMQNRSVPMEPDRDERMPWSGHPAKTSESEGWAFDVASFYEHFLHNYRAHQADDGSLQEILPPYWLFNGKDIVWPSVATIIPDWYYNFYGDERPLRDNYDMMKRFVLYHEQANLKADGTLDHCTYGDWVDTASIGSNSRNFGATSRPLIGTAYFYRNCRIVERAARLLGKQQDQEYFAALADRVRQGFLGRFFDPATASFESRTQCSYVLPLAFGLAPQEHREAIVKNLVDDIMVQHRGHTSVGLIGMQWQMQVLTDIGHPEVAYRIATRTERPSWGYMFSQGATTSWERWDTDSQDGGMNGESQKILSGNFEAWCYQTLGGINYVADRPGFKHIVLRPRPVGDLTWVRASHNSPHGWIQSDWRIEDDRFQWRVVVPPNTTATAHVPTSDPSSVRESDGPAESGGGVKLLRRDPHAAVYEIGSGVYQFSAPAWVLE